MPRQNLTPLLRPQSVAIVGISQAPRFGGWVYQNLLNLGYAGRIYGVNPRYAALHDQPCYPSLAALPEVPDCAILALPNDRLLPALQEAAALGVKATIISASAYSDPAPGQPSLIHQLKQTADDHSMVMCGPNCMGLIAFASRFGSSGYPIAAGIPSGNVAFITHSGTVFDSVWQNTRGIHFNYLISSGNEIVTTLADYVQFALTDPSTRVIGLFLETVRDPATFRLALQQAAESDVPIVALKVGRSEEGAKLAQTHSGALTGDDAVYEALFDYYGVQRVKNLDEMMDTLELFTAGLRPPTPYIASIHDSGGERGLLVDLADSEGVQFAPISPATQQKLAGIIESGLAPVNPLDAWGTGNDFGSIYLKAMLALDSDPDTGLNLWVGDFYAAGVITDTYSRLAIEHKSQFTKPLVFLSNLAAAVSPTHAAGLRAAGIPLLMGTENGLRAIKHLLDYSEFQRQQTPLSLSVAAPMGGDAGEGWRPLPPQVQEIRCQLQTASAALDEHASKTILRAYGIATPPESLADSLDATLNAAQGLGYPVALKTAAGELHKSDRGGVILNLADSVALTTAYRKLNATFGPRVLIQKMVPPGVELLLGLVNDPQFGPMLTLGLGGIFVEVFKDAKLLALPTTPDRVRTALLGLKAAPLLKGARSRPPVDIEAIVAAAVGLSALATDLGDVIEAVDVNPLIALAAGAMAVDALIVPKKAI